MTKKHEIEIEILPANEGDCLLITIINEDIHILIDGGTANTYRTYLRERLIQLRNDGKAIDLLVVTHIDNDHIGGIIELLKENGSNENPHIIEIRNIWHNSYRHLQFDKKDALGKKEKNILNNIISNGEANLNRKLNNSEPISALQGTTLAGLIYKGNYHWNEQFEGKAILNNQINYRFGEKCCVSVLKPKKFDLEKLEKKWKKYLKSSKFSFAFSNDVLFDDAFEYYCRFLRKDATGYNEKISYNNRKIEEMNIKDISKIITNSDSSITNRSSISIVIYYGNKKLLFLADNIASEALEDLSQKEMNYSLVKLPHHGSESNIDDCFIKNVETGIYLVSTNSEKYNHPDLETLAKIACKKTDYVKKIYFNYKVEKVVKFEQKIDKINNIEFIYLKKGQKIYL